MVEPLFATGGPARLSVFFSAVLLAAVFVACSHADEDPAKPSSGANQGQGNGGTSATVNAPFGNGEEGPLFGDENLANGDVLWNTPDLPSGITVSIDEVPVEFFVVEGYLMPLWSDYASSLPLETPIDELTDGFFAKPEELFYNLVRGVVLLREAETRFAELDEHALEDYKYRMEAAAGTAMESLVKRYGEDGWQAHVERKFRLQLLLDDFQQYAAEVTEEELFAFYDSEILAQLPEPEKREHIDISFTAMEPSLRANLMKSRAVEAQEAWLDGQLDGIDVKTTLPADLSHSWTLSGPR